MLTAHRQIFSQVRCYSSSPLPVYKPKLLRPQTKREKWIDTLKRMDKPTNHLALTGGYIHQYLFEAFQKDARTLGVKYIYHNIYDLENHVLLPEIQKRLVALGLPTHGDYPEARARLNKETRLFNE